MTTIGRLTTVAIAWTECRVTGSPPRRLAGETSTKKARLALKQGVPGVQRAAMDAATLRPSVDDARLGVLIVRADAPQKRFARIIDPVQ